MEITKELALDIADSDKGNEFTYQDKVYETVYSSGWKANGKYDHKTIVFRFEDKFYEITNTRSGSYHTDYWFESEDWDDSVEVAEVVPVDVVTTVYKRV